MAAQDLKLLAEDLCQTACLFGARQWCLATSGNFSARVDASRCLITRSGTDKAVLEPDGLMLCALDGSPADPSLVPSAEIALHLCLYRYDRQIAAVLHTHSVAATVVSRRANDPLEITGFEMLKAFPGIAGHEETIRVPVFDNTQDMPALARALQERLAAWPGSTPAFLVRGHGLYAWGDSLAAARRHLEGVEFLLDCLLAEGASGP